MRPLRPAYISLESSTMCQLRCRTCPTGQRQISSVVGVGFLRFENFRTLLQQSPWVKHIELCNFGEMLLNPDLPRILEYAQTRGVKLYAQNGVNFNTADDALIESLVRHKLRALTCSIDGASQQTYEKYRIGGHFDTVIAHIRRLNDFKRQYKSKYPRLTWQFVIFGHNEHEIPAAQQRAQELGMHFRVKLNWDDSFEPVRNPEFVQQVTGLKVVSRKDFEKHSGGNYAAATCHQLWDRPQINWNGKNLGCCWNCWGDFGGNAFEDGLEAMLNNERMNHARLMLQGKAPAREDIPCTTCDNYKSLVARGRWLRRGVGTKANTLIFKAAGKFIRVLQGAKMKKKR